MRRLWFLALLVSIPFVEVAVTVLLTAHLGAARTYSLFAIPTVIGLLFQWHAWTKLKARAAACPNPWKKHRHFSGKRLTFEVQRDPDFPTWLVLQFDTFLFWLGTTLLLIPGVVTDLLGFALMLPPLRTRIFDPT